MSRVNWQMEIFRAKIYDDNARIQEILMNARKFEGMDGCHSFFPEIPAFKQCQELFRKMGLPRKRESVGEAWLWWL